MTLQQLVEEKFKELSQSHKDLIIEFIENYKDYTSSTRVCVKCKRELPFDQNHFMRKSRRRDGFNNACKECNGYKFGYREAIIPDENGYRTCSKCGEKLLLNNLNFIPAKQSRCGLSTACRSCVKKYNRAYLSKNPIINKNNKKYKRRHRTIKTINEKIAKNTRRYIYTQLKHLGLKKQNKTINLLGCSFSFYRMYIESQFTSGMAWNNYGNGDGKWNIDHIRPVASFDLSDNEQLHQAFHYSNTKPLFSIDNLKKGSMWNGYLYRHKTKPPSN